MEVHEQLLHTTARCLARYEAYTGAGPLLAKLCASLVIESNAPAPICPSFAMVRPTVERLSRYPEPALLGAVDAWARRLIVLT